jgi:antitoxin (DNA-binding transcriptional repressor) of toxin-antitoxin stability system
VIYADKLAEYVNLRKVKTIEVTKITSLNDLVILANQESEVVLTQDNKPVAKVLPIASLQEAPDGKSARRTLGLHRRAWMVSVDFDQPLPDEFWFAGE